MADLTLEEVTADLKRYHTSLSSGASDFRMEIERKYGVYGLAPNKVVIEMLDLIDDIKLDKAGNNE